MLIAKIIVGFVEFEIIVFCNFLDKEIFQRPAIRRIVAKAVTGFAINGKTIGVACHELCTKQQ